MVEFDFHYFDFYWCKFIATRYTWNLSGKDLLGNKGSPKFLDPRDFFKRDERVVSYLSEDEIKLLKLAHVGRGVLISSKCIINNPEVTTIGDYSRIDDLTILSGNVSIGNYVHITVMNNIAGGRFGVSIGNYAGLAYGCHIFAQTDDYTGNSLVGPLFPEEMTSVTGGRITIGDYSTIGTGAIIFPKVNLREGSAIGAMSLVNKDTDPWGVYVGNPARRVKERSQTMKEILEKNFNPK